MHYDDFPDCCGMGIIYRLSSELGTGYEPADLNGLDEMEARARDVGVTIAILSTVETQGCDTKLSKKNWIPVFSFTNRNSGNTVTVWIKNVQDGSGWQSQFDADIKFLQEKK